VLGRPSRRSAGVESQLQPRRPRANALTSGREVVAFTGVEWTWKLALFTHHTRTVQRSLLPPLSRSILSPVLRVGFDRPDPAPLTAGSLAGWCRDGSEARLPPCSSSFRIRCSLWVNPVFPLVESEGRPVAIVGRSHRVSSQPPPSSFRWWQVVRQMELADSCIPLNKAESASYSLAHPSCAKRLRFFFFFLVVLSWAEPVPGRRR
jgi:hypothetical protein